MDEVNQPVTPPQAPDQMHSSFENSNSSKVIPIIIVAILLVLVGAGSYLLGTKKSSTIVADKVTSQPSPTLSPTPTPDPTANWKTYTNYELKYSFKYPEEWPIINTTIKDPDACAETLIFSPNYIPNSGESTLGVIMVCPNPRIKSIDDYIDILLKGDSSVIDIKNTTIDEEKAVSYKLSGGMPPLPIIEYAVVKNGFYYIIRQEDSTETNKNRDINIKIFNQILSTLKFTQ